MQTRSWSNARWSTAYLLDTALAAQLNNDRQEQRAVRVATQYAPARCTPDAAAQLQPIPYACGAQRALLPIAVGATNINELMNINDVGTQAFTSAGTYIINQLVRTY